MFLTVDVVIPSFCASSFNSLNPNDAPSSVIFERMNLSSLENLSRTSVDLCWLSESYIYADISL